MQQQSPQLSFPHPVARKTSGGLKMAIPSYMQDKLKGIEQTFNQLTNSLADPDVLNDSKQLMKISKERSKLEEIVEAFQEYKSREADLTGAKELFSESAGDPEMREMARDEIDECETVMDELQEKLKILLLPTDPNDERNCMLEIRSGSFKHVC
ncbi:unnamed protein product [Heterosigma akashiwo]